MGITDFTERVGFDLGKFVLHVIWVHGADLLAGWRSQHLDNLN